MRMFLTLVVLCVLAMPAFAQDDEAEIRGVITDQLQAFNDRDIDEAWTHASPMIQGLFGSPSNFGMMVENGYPMVWTNRDPRFTQLDELGDRMRQRVIIEDSDGVIHALEYVMIETESGWKIDGVSLVPAPDVGA
ncbi:DUF4864 domain-containing protein [Pelagovum pacificum]|uniref:DUF4864 domain-containing protein n=1 Tax=Pelagovum pacificum TaxID=2588711 RepID=A0A5C5GBG5_9RHOB|nr:DUF4864 domain-containing protein [Pelagovum pacificum]QQA42228.1 DUF4864 domain-containing protein [Pelagovum pacificum]TNY31314.1 DUF4864 domain-containing protein [Pelagovum pacificum]